MANTESTWSLHCNSIPKCLAVYTTPHIPPIPMRSSGGGGGSTSTTTGALGGGYSQLQQGGGLKSNNNLNPFDLRIRNSNNNTNTGINTNSNNTNTTNPFDVATSTSSLSSTSDLSSSAAMNIMSSSTTTTNNSIIPKATYSVVYGTERGTLHYRTYPMSSNRSNKIGYDSSNYIMGTAIPPIGVDVSKRLGGGNVSGSGGNTGNGVHPMHQPMDVTNVSTSAHQLPIVACVRFASPQRSNNPSNMNSNSNGNGNPIQRYRKQNNAIYNPIFLLLQDDEISKHNSNYSHRSNSTSNSPSTVTTGTFQATLISLHLKQQQQQQHNNLSSLLLEDLPRMSSVTYHPSTGYIYSTGSSIYSLPSKAVYAISSSLSPNHSYNTTTSSMTNATTNSTNPFGGSSTPLGVGTRDTQSLSVPTSNTTSTPHLPKLYYHSTNILPPCGVRSCNGGLSIICNGHVVVAAMKNGSFYAVNGRTVSERFWKLQLEKETGREHTSGGNSGGKEIDLESKGDVEKILTFRQSSPVHPAISIEIPMCNTSTASKDGSGNGENDHGKEDYNDNHDEQDEEEVCTSLVFLASGRECAVVEILYNPKLYSNNQHGRMEYYHDHNHNSSNDPADSSLLPSSSISYGSIVVGPPRHGIATLASPILAAVGLTPPRSSNQKKRTSSSGRSSKSSPTSSSTYTPLVAILTSDGLVHTRSPSFISIPLSTIEVGNRPNDFFTLQPLPNRQVVAGSYSGEARLISFREDTVQDLADRMMKLSIDAFGSNGFPRAEVAEVIGATFSATSYVGSEPSAGARNTLRQYLETCLGLDMSGDFGGAALYKRFLYAGVGDGRGEEEGENGDDDMGEANPLLSSFAASYLCATAMLCLVCTRLSTPNSSLANRAAKACATKFGTVGNIQQTGINESTVKVCELVAQMLLTESESTRSLPSSSGIATGKNGIRMDMVEAASWLLRSCGQHENSIKILQERMTNPTIRNKTFVERPQGDVDEATKTKHGAGWSQLKYDSHLCLHLGELWSSGYDNCRGLVLKTSATRRLLENNPELGLRIFTSMLPQNEDQWLRLRDDPLCDTNITPTEVVEMLKTIRPLVRLGKDDQKLDEDLVSDRVNGDSVLPLESGRALAVAYLESLIGISTGKPSTKDSNVSQDKQAEIHNELAFLLLEGVLSERSDGRANCDSDLGKIYREKLRRLLGWHSSKVQPDQLMDALPSSFLREKALLLGQLGRHEDALRIFYSDLKNLELALEYCDARYEKQQAQNRYEFTKSYYNNKGSKSKVNQGCAYLPLVRVTLESNLDSERGIAAAIKVLSLRRENIDQAAALRLLPKNVPVSAIARTFLIPALIDSESQTRRLTVTSSLLRAKYLRLKQSLTEAQIKSQSILQNIPALQSLNLGDAVYTSNPFKARPSNTSSLHSPEVMITKHFFPRYVIIQATATAPNGMIVLGDIQLVVAESSDEALLPSVNISIKTLPAGMTGSSWCVLAASPQRLDGTAILVCEIHYSVAPISASSASSYQPGSGRSYVEEIQDIEIRRAEFEG